MPFTKKKQFLCLKKIIIILISSSLQSSLWLHLRSHKLKQFSTGKQYGH